MAATLCQVLGFFLSLLGIAGIIAATGMDQSAEDHFNSMCAGGVSFHSGLWRSCARQSSGFTECLPYVTILDPPALLRGARALMIVGIVIGSIGCMMAIIALTCLKMGNNMKAMMTLASGIMFVLAGVCGIAGVSAFANLMVQGFWFSAYVVGGMRTSGGGNKGGLTLGPTGYSFGPALFVGWVSAAVLVVGGVTTCLACRGMVPDKQQRYDGTAYKPASIFKSDPRPRQPFNASDEAQRGPLVSFS
ncbi:claudin-18-like [Diretmus argenteus]